MLKNLLTVTDELAEQPLIVTLRLTPHEDRHQRPVMLTLGEEGQTPVFVSGTLTQLPALLNQAYEQYSQLERTAPDQTPLQTAVAAKHTPPAATTKPPTSLSIF